MKLKPLTSMKLNVYIKIQTSTSYKCTLDPTYITEATYFVDYCRFPSKRGPNILVRLRQFILSLVKTFKISRFIRLTES